MSTQPKIPHRSTNTTKPDIQERRKSIRIAEKEAERKNEAHSERKVQASVSRASTTKRPLPTESVQPTKRQKQNTVSTKQTSTPKRTKPSTNVTRPSNVGGVRATKRNVEPLKERRTSIRIAEKKAEQKVVPEAHLEGKAQASTSRVSTTKRSPPTESAQSAERQRQNTASTKRTTMPKRTKSSIKVTRPSNVGGVEAANGNMEPMQIDTTCDTAEKKKDTDPPLVTDFKSIEQYYMYIRLQQWRYLNARSEKAWEQQLTSAKKQLEDAWKALNLRRLRVFKLEQEVQALERAHELYHQLPKQTSILEQLDTALGKDDGARKHLDATMHALHETAKVFPVKDITSTDLSQLACELEKGAKAAKKTCEQHGLLDITNNETIEQTVAKSMNNLQLTVDDELRKLRDCQKAINELTLLESIYQSRQVARMVQHP